jgi:hypothetical protein
MDTLSGAMRRLQADGYTGNWFATSDHQLSCTVTGDVIDPATVGIDHILRFEGQSDPDDMTILYALRSPTGTKGLYSAPFGANTPADDVAVIARMPHQPADGSLDG